MRSIGDVLKVLEHSIPRNTGNGEVPPPEIPDCPLCKDAGYLRANVPITDPRFGQLIPCECRLKKEAEKKHEQLLEIGNLHAFADKTFDTFDPKVHRSVAEALNIAMEYASDPAGSGKPWLLLWGLCGTGKTHLAAAIANHYVTYQGGQALFAIVPDLLDHLRATFNPAATSGITYDQRFQDVRDVPLLILDDLGTENATPWAKEKLFQIFNHRYNQRLSTVITTNHSFSQIEERIMSRLLDVALCEEFQIDSEDYRLRGRDPRLSKRTK